MAGPREVSTPAGTVRPGTLLQFVDFIGNPGVGSVLRIDPDGRNGQATLLLECGDAGRWCYPHQVTRILED